MPRLTSVAAALPIALFLSMAGSGCDPDAPGASGTITLGTGVDAASFQSLTVRSFPNWAGTFGPSSEIPSDAYQEDVAIAAIKFPYPYRVSGTVGTSGYANWEMVAWLSPLEPAVLADFPGPNPGDAFCAVAYRVAPCGFQGGYCGVTNGVDCVLLPMPAWP